ncbi:MAG: hypothetical protein JWP37_2995 [Mucilaginibacter sp.]|nr:hypothetical protein [Mucilaginibacter sp.]
MKYFFILLFMTSLNCFGQDYKAQIAAYRKGYTEDFLKDKSSPLKETDLQFLRFYDADSTYRVEAKVVIISNAPTFVMPSFNGSGQQYIGYAVLKFMLKGKPMQLMAYSSIALSKLPEYSNYLFIPFTDDTNGAVTYTGGRYIDLSKADLKGDSIVIDFNKAYNPYCAFGGGYSCPKPPEENQLRVPIEAGEKLFAGANKH